MPNSLKSVQAPTAPQLSPSRRAVLAVAAGVAGSMTLPGITAATDGRAALRKEKTMDSKLSPTLLTPETSGCCFSTTKPTSWRASGQRTMTSSNSTDAPSRATKVFKVPVILSTMGVKLRGDPATLPSIRSDLAGEPEYDRNTMNSWEDGAFR